MVQSAFYINVFIHYVIFIMVIWSIVKPEKRIWPPPYQYSWQYFVYWLLFIFSVIIDIYIMVYDFDTWVIPDEIRIWIGIPLMLIGGAFSLWSIIVLGIKNTSGLKEGFVVELPYSITRNPQYLGDIVLITGLILFMNSLYVTVMLVLTIMAFVMMPLAEERWLQENYGEDYEKYKNSTSRFL